MKQHVIFQLLLVPLWLFSVVSGETLWVVEEGSVEITNGGPTEETTIVDVGPFVLGGKYLSRFLSLLLSFVFLHTSLIPSSLILQLIISC
jgi:hypothetical protein